MFQKIAQAIAAVTGSELQTGQMAEVMRKSASDDQPVAKKRNYHAWLHPRKGWRNFARPAGTNRRRRLIPTGYLGVHQSHEYRRTQGSGGRQVPACKFR